VPKAKKETRQRTKKTSKKTEATSMDDLLKNYSWHGFKKGEVVEGIITEKIIKRFGLILVLKPMVLF